MEKVDFLIKEANSHLNSWSLFNPYKDERAAELFQQAAKICHHNNLNDKSIDLYDKALKCKIPDFEKAQIHEEKAIIYSLDSLRISEMEDSYLKAIYYYELCTYFNNNLRIYKKLSDYFYNNEKWEKAEKYLDLTSQIETSSITRKSYLEKLFYSQIHMGKYNEAIKTSKFISINLESSALRWSLTQILFKAGLCALIEDKVICKRNIEQYRLIDTNYNKRPYELLEKLITINDVNDFIDIISEYNRTSKFDEIEQLLLLKIKETFTDNDSLL